MATEALGDERPALFLRKATGLVRGWSVRDSMIYAVLSTNFVTLALFEFTFAGPAFPTGQLLTSVVISAILVSFLVVAYTGLITTIPRAGGDYVWQTRILGGGIGFVFAVTGWWFILWLWAPIYGNILAIQFFEPLWATLGSPSGAAWFGTNNGIFVVSLITIVLAGILVSIGMAGYARIQKYCIYGGLIGFAVIVVLLLINSHADFIASFNQEAQKIFGVNHAYAATNAAAVKAGFTAPSLGFGPLGATLLLVPNVVIFFLLMAKTFGWAFYQNANAAFFNGTFPIPVWPYPFMFAGWLVHNAAFQVILILVMSLWFFGWVGTLFLSSTRVIFAAAFDRVLPDRAAEVSEKRQVPFYSLVLMLLPAAGLSAIYAYSLSFRNYFLDATLVIAVTYLFSAIAVVILPWRKPALWAASPASRFKFLGIPIVLAAGWVTIGLLVFCLYEWFSNSLYFVNNNDSLIFMGAMYVLAIIVYALARVLRKRQGIDLGLVNKEIPVE